MLKKLTKTIDFSKNKIYNEFVKKINKRRVMKLRVNIEAVLQLIEERFRNNKSFFAETIGVDPSYLNSVLNKKAIDHSPKICNGIVRYCKQNNLNETDYIFLE
jgi:hypothetical protein